MDEVADVSGGVHFNVSGRVADQEEELRDVFLRVAERRPLELVD